MANQSPDQTNAKRRRVVPEGNADDDYYTSERMGFEAASSFHTSDNTHNAESIVPTSSTRLETSSSKPSFAERQMAKMGFKAGHGLGKKEEGITAPIQESMQLGRRGLGFAVDGLERTVVEDQEVEETNVKIPLQWAPECPEDAVLPENFKDWSTEDVYKSYVVSHQAFAESTVLADLNKAKTLLDNISRKEFLSARDRANPFEGLRSEFFQNRAALKMAEMDAIFDFVFTAPVHLSPWRPLYFADICAGPGGFSEYIMWRKRWRAKGFGFTLVNNLDFKLGKFNTASPWDSFHTFYGVDNRGDIYKNENVRALRQLIVEETKGAMVHFVMADGGMDFTKDQNAQELTNTQLLLCQVMCAMAILGTGGHFVLKTFDLFSKMSVDLIYLIWTHFEHVTIFKPNQSRPANSERYVFAKGFRAKAPKVVEYLMGINATINELKEGVGAHKRQSRAVVGLVPDAILPKEFLSYLAESNDVLGQKQVASLRKVHNFIRDPSLPGEDQSRIRFECLEYWQVPTTSPVLPRDLDHVPPAVFLRDSPLMHCVDGDPRQPAPPTTTAAVRMLGERHIQGPKAIMSKQHEWRMCVIDSANEDGCFMTMPNRVTYFKSAVNVKAPWQAVDGLIMPPYSFVCGQLIGEWVAHAHNRTGRIYQVLHVRDAMILGGVDIRRQPYEERLQNVKIFCESISRDPRVTAPPISVTGARIHVRAAMVTTLARVKVREATNAITQGECTLRNIATTNVHQSASGIMFFPVCVNSPAGGWVRELDEKQCQFHWYNVATDKTAPDTTFRCLPLSFRKTMDARMLWLPHTNSITREVLLDALHA